MNKISVAITGGIGSGKSTIALMLKHMGFPIFFADKQAATVIESNISVMSNLRLLLGNDIYLNNGMLNKQKMAESIFGNTEIKQKVNSIVHPAVWEAFNEWSKAQTSPIIFMESAILFECGWADRFDKIICVTAEQDVRIARTMLRDALTEEQVRKRIDNQLSEVYKVSHSNFIIRTDECYSELEQLLAILQELKD